MEYISSIVLYVLIFILSFILIRVGHSFKKGSISRKTLIISGILIPSIVAGVRYYVGYDYGTYLLMFNKAEIGHEIYFRAIEPISSMIIVFAGLLRSRFVMFFLFNLISNGCVYMAFKKILVDDKKVSFAYLIYLFILYSTSLNAVRSGAAMAVAVLGLSYLYEGGGRKNVIIAAVLLLLASLIHLSMVITLLFVPAFYYSGKGKNNSKRKAVIWVICSIGALMLPKLIGNYVPNMGDYTRYLTGIGKSFSIPQANLLMMAQMLVLYLYSFVEVIDERDKRLLYCSLYYVPLSIFAGWITYVDGLSRISFILEPIIICLMASIFIECNKKRSLLNMLLAVIIMAVTGIMFIRNLYWSGALPYRISERYEEIYVAKN